MRPNSNGSRRRVRARALAITSSAWFALAAAACKPDLNEVASLVTGPRILAVRAEPAEGPPKTKVTLTALVVDAAGAVAGAPVDWAFCNARKPLAELGPVSPHCLVARGDWLIPLGAGTRVSGAIPDVACRQFGPEVPLPQAGQPPGRPVDPDSTGGYYQPARLLWPNASGITDAIAEMRLSCGAAGATPDQAVEFARRYRANANPAVDGVAIVGGAALVPDDGVAGAAASSSPVLAGARLALRVTWPSCPVVDVCGDGVCGPDESASGCPADCTNPIGCSGAERYVTYDLASRAVVVQREGIHVSWFMTGGSLDRDRTGRDGNDQTSTNDNGWQAPAQAGSVRMWVVLQDDRGGVGWRSFVLDVQR